jgi:iron-sulfur cluster assembly protein
VSEAIQPVVPEFPVILTGPAIEHLKEARSREGLDGSHAVRIGVSEGGCSGMSYSLGFDAGTRPDDVVADHEGLRVVVSGDAVRFLQGVTIDYVESLTSAGFKFVNPNATRTCGCGTSFS